MYEACIGQQGGTKQTPIGESKAVIFVPFTVNSQLAKDMREKETMLEKLTGYIMKVVEKTGVKLERLLHKSDPWAGQDCLRQGCLLCTTKTATGKHLTQNCSARNVLYETWCQTCKERDETNATEDGKDPTKVIVYKYIGESARSCFERGNDHIYDCKQILPKRQLNTIKKRTRTISIS